MKTSEALEQALVTMTREGWTKKAFWREDTGCFCAVGALRQAIWGTTHSPLGRYGDGVGDDDWQTYKDAVRRVSHAAGGGRAYGTQGLLDFNDNPRTTFEDIVTAFEGAITVAKAREQA